MSEAQDGGLRNTLYRTATRCALAAR